jgi:anti-sigma-K factor RskA
MTMLNENDIALAGEYVLGLLDSAEQAKAQALIATDTVFAAEVTAWQERLQSMATGGDVTPPDRVWAAIDRTLPAAAGQDNVREQLRMWKGLTAASIALAAFTGIALWNQAPAPLPAAPAPLVAALGSENGKAAITARYDSQSGELLLTPVSLDTGNLYPELWIVPADGKARSLGMMAGDKPTRVIVSAEMHQYMAEGGTLAVTPEPAGGAPGGKATGPIIASGKITTI